MLIIFMRNYLKVQLRSKVIFFGFRKDYILMKPLVQADGFGRFVFEKVEKCRVRWRCWPNNDANVTSVIGDF